MITETIRIPKIAVYVTPNTLNKSYWIEFSVKVVIDDSVHSIGRIQYPCPTQGDAIADMVNEIVKDTGKEIGDYLRTQPMKEE